MSDPLIQVVDKNDKPLRGADKHEIWSKGLIVRVVRIMIQDSKGRILLQKRGPNLELYPGRWDNSVAGHVDEGESYEQAAKREIKEESGLDNVPLTFVTNYYAETKFDEKDRRCFINLYTARLDKLPKVPNTGEVVEFRWFNTTELADLMNNHPDQVTDGLQQVYGRLYENKQR